MSPCPFFVNHHTRSTFNSQFFKKSTKKMIVLTDPQVWDHAYQKLLKEDADLHDILEF